MTRAWQKGLAAVASVSALTMLLAGCGTSTTGNTSPAATNTKPLEGGSVTIDFIQNIRDLDPALAYDSQSDEIVDQLYDQLVTWKQGGSSEIVPMAAQSWTVSKDGLTYTFKIRKGMKFWNGDPVTAQSFITEFYRVLSPQLGSPGAGFFMNIVGAADYNAGKTKTIPGLTAPDPYTLQIRLVKPEAFLLDTLTMNFISAVDPKFIESVGNHQLYEKNPAFDSTQAEGSGPFELQTINANQIILTKNPNYWRTDSYGQKLPYLDKVTININNNDAIDTEHFEQGQTAWIGDNFGGDGIPSSQYPTFMANPNYKKLTITKVENSVQYLGLNTTIGPTKNPLVRQAIEYAIDKQAILQLNNGRGQVANQPLPPGIPGYVQNLPADATYDYNIQKAKQLLAKAGYPHGFTIDMYDENSPDQQKFDQAVQAQLAQVGITVKLHESSWGTFLNVAESGKAPMFWLAWGQDFPDASDFLNTLFNFPAEGSVNDCTNYNNPQVNAWLNDAQYSTNQARRLQDYKNATIQIMKDAPWVPMWYDTFTGAAQPWVHGFYIPDVGSDPIEWIWIDKGHSQG